MTTPLPHGRSVALMFCALLAVWGTSSTWAERAPAPVALGAEQTLNLRDFGATGDGRIHRVSEWIESGRFIELRTLQMKYPFVDSLTWTIDEVAFACAKRALGPAGGTIYFPAGHYVTGKYSWRIWQDNVRLLGDGAEQTLLSTAPEIADALSVAPYRHSGWLEGAAREFAFKAESGRSGDDGVTLLVPASASAFKSGELVFIRDGANRFDQDYGEFNEIAGVDANGRLHFKHALSRDYTLANINWAGEVATDFVMPFRGGSVKVTIRTGEGYFSPPARCTISIGENLFTVDKTSATTLSLGNCGPGNAPRGTLIRAGSKISKSRSVLKLTRTVRNFRCEKLQVIGRRKALNLSNSYETQFADCKFVRALEDGAFAGGVTVDGDGGRFARFDRCTIEARPSVGMQFARSFGGVVFSECTFTNTNVAFTEFNFDCEVARCAFDVTGGPNLLNVIVAGNSCDNLRFIENRIRASGVAAVFERLADIHSQKHPSGGFVLVRGNTMERERNGRALMLPLSERFAIEDTSVPESARSPAAE